MRRGSDIHYIREGDIVDQAYRWNRSRAYAWLFWLPFLASFALILYRAAWEPLVRRSRRLEARRVLSRTLRDLRLPMDLGRAAASLEGYLSLRLGLKPSRMTAAAIARALEDRRVEERDIRDLLAFKEEIESRRFMMPAGGGAGGGVDLERLRALLRRIDGKIR